MQRGQPVCSWTRFDRFTGQCLWVVLAMFHTVTEYHIYLYPLVFLPGGIRARGTDGSLRSSQRYLLDWARRRVTTFHYLILNKHILAGLHCLRCFPPHVSSPVYRTRLTSPVYPTRQLRIVFYKVFFVLSCCLFISELSAVLPARLFECCHSRRISEIGLVAEFQPK